jgi:hypothetical protein
MVFSMGLAQGFGSDMSLSLRLALGGKAMGNEALQELHDVKDVATGWSLSICSLQLRPQMS